MHLSSHLLAVLVDVEGGEPVHALRVAQGPKLEKIQVIEGTRTYTAPTSYT